MKVSFRVLIITLCAFISTATLIALAMVLYAQKFVTDNSPSYSYRFTDAEGFFTITDGNKKTDVTYNATEETLVAAHEYLQTYSQYTTTLNNGQSAQAVIANYYSNYAYKIESLFPENLGYISNFDHNIWTKMLGSDDDALQAMQILSIPKAQNVNDFGKDKDKQNKLIDQLLSYAGITGDDNYKISLQANNNYRLRLKAVFKNIEVQGSIRYHVGIVNAAPHFDKGELRDKDQIVETDKRYVELSKLIAIPIAPYIKEYAKVPSEQLGKATAQQIHLFITPGCVGDCTKYDQFTKEVLPILKDKINSGEISMKLTFLYRTGGSSDAKLVNCMASQTDIYQALQDMSRIQQYPLFRTNVGSFYVFLFNTPATEKFLNSYQVDKLQKCLTGPSNVDNLAEYIFDTIDYETKVVMRLSDGRYIVYPQVNDLDFKIHPL